MMKNQKSPSPGDRGDVPQSMPNEVRAELAELKVEQALMRYKLLLQKARMWVTEPEKRAR